MNVQPGDVLCDFCHAAWDGESPVVEGHQGSIVCGKCLTVAYRSVVLLKESSGPPGCKCVMCLEQSDRAAWQSPAYPDAHICRRCIDQAAGTLHKDKDYDWKKPGGA